jgi:hypothetical protein
MKECRRSIRMRFVSVWHFATTGAICSTRLISLWLSSGLLLGSLGCAGQFELDIPDEHPARASAQSAPIAPAPSPYDQHYPIARQEDESIEEPRSDAKTATPSEMEQ